MNYCFIITEGAHAIVLFENMYFYCTYLTKATILSMLGTGYFLKIATIVAQSIPSVPIHRHLLGILLFIFYLFIYSLTKPYTT